MEEDEIRICLLQNGKIKSKNTPIHTLDKSIKNLPQSAKSVGN